MFFLIFWHEGVTNEGGKTENCRLYSLMETYDCEEEAGMGADFQDSEDGDNEEFLLPDLNILEILFLTWNL